MKTFTILSDRCMKHLNPEVETVTLRIQLKETLKKKKIDMSETDMINTTKPEWNKYVNKKVL